MGKMGPIKVGITSDIKNRLIGLQVGNPEQLRILHFEEFEDEKAKSMEREFHLMFKDAAMKGEWFKPIPYILDIIEDIKNNGILKAYYNEAEKTGGGYLQRVWTLEFSEAFNTMIHAAQNLRKYGHYPTYKAFVEEIEDLLESIKAGRY